MIAAIPIQTDSYDSSICLKFARSRYFAILNKSAKNIEFIENPFYKLEKGAGKKIVELLIDTHNVSAFVAYELGLKVQQIAIKKNISLVMISEHHKQLNDLVQMMIPDFKI